MTTERGELAAVPRPTTTPSRMVKHRGDRERGELVADTTRGPGAAVVVVVLSRLLTAAERLRGISIVDPHAAISIPLQGSDVPPDLDAVARAAWAVAVGPDGSGPGAPAVIQALTRALTVAELLRQSGDEPHRAIAVPLRYGPMPRGLAFVVWGAWAFAVGLDADREARGACLERHDGRGGNAAARGA